MHNPIFILTLTIQKSKSDINTYSQPNAPKNYKAFSIDKISINKLLSLKMFSCYFAEELADCCWQTTNCDNPASKYLKM